ncbi:hypothetical protein ABEB36_011754 [Hypothenemus hampei]|uniref:Medium-chain acyl-CoA ligase ACSF2, mitochondrial n=1 Tax=Hypothenemus hampei TaxID=57062 RepID=A0ABD1E9M9_HYPHA
MRQLIIKIRKTQPFFARNFGNDLSYFHHTCNEPLRALTMGQLLEKTTNKYPDRPALISRHQKQVLTFQQVLEQADTLAAAFKIIGLQPQDRVGIWAPNMVEWYVTHIACARGGFILVNLNPAFQRQEIKNLINTIGIRGIVCAHKFKSQNYYQHLQDICPELSKCPPGGLKSPNAPSLKSIIVISEENLQGTFKYNDLFSMASTSEINEIGKNQEFIDPGQECHFQTTSGSTGNPKVPVQTHFQQFNNSYFLSKNFGFDKQQQVLCLPLPFFHVFGGVVGLCSALHYGGTIVLPSASFEVDKTLEALKGNKCTMIYGTPTLYVDLINRLEQTKEKVNVGVAVTGGATTDKRLFKKMKKILGVQKIKSVYGLTETTSGIFHSLDDEDELQVLETVGKLAEHMEAKVVDSEGRIVRRGMSGELLIRGYATTLGYWQNPEKTNELFDSDKWLHTGDEFILYENGYGKMVGRISDIIIRGGENIYPKPIEDLLNIHPNILQAQVVGVPHERLGEEVCAVLRVESNANVTVEDIRSFLKGKIAHFNIPSRVEIVDEFAKTSIGKVHKRKIIQNILNQ